MEKSAFSKVNLSSAITRYRGLSITVGIILILVGICMSIFPRISTIAWYIIFMVGLLAVGIACIVQYARDKSGQRSGWLLAYGIISIVLSALLILSLVFDIINRDSGVTVIQIIGANTAIFLFWFILIYAWCAIFQGIFRLIAVNSAVAAGANRGYEITMGVLAIVFGAFVTIFPFTGAEIVYWIGIYAIAISFVVIGIILLAKLPQKDAGKKKDVKDVNSKPVE